MQRADVARANLLEVDEETSLGERGASDGDGQHRERAVRGGLERQQHQHQRRPDEPDALDELAHRRHGHPLGDQRISQSPREHAAQRHRRPRQRGEVRRLGQLQSHDLLEVQRHPRQEDEVPPVVHEVGHDARPHRSLAQQ